MRFALLDRIDVLVPGERIEAVKCLSLAEEYLADHFPQAPVLPGVMMLQSLVEAGSWLVRYGQRFERSLVTLKQVRGVKYANFVEPGRTLQVTAEITGTDGRETKLKAQGVVAGAVAVAARLVLQSSNLRDSAAGDKTSQQDAASQDAFVIERIKQSFRLLYPSGEAALAE
ncbi:MAG: beta-hydroxyacyl-ACP dehydratase [Pirellulales bacterium]|nr:beta-hydroxyacyl-ACP dehydratase [Pirellulales bacterium]